MDFGVKMGAGIETWKCANILQIKYESQCNKICLNPILILSFSFTSLHCIIATISIFARLSNIYIALSAICSIDKVLLQ